MKAFNARNRKTVLRKKFEKGSIRLGNCIENQNYSLKRIRKYIRVYGDTTILKPKQRYRFIVNLCEPLNYSQAIAMFNAANNKALVKEQRVAKHVRLKRILNAFMNEKR